jgi:hypothetical protein
MMFEVNNKSTNARNVRFDTVIRFKHEEIGGNLHYSSNKQATGGSLHNKSVKNIRNLHGTPVKNTQQNQNKVHTFLFYIYLSYVKVYEYNDNN